MERKGLSTCFWITLLAGVVAAQHAAWIPRNSDRSIRACYLTLPSPLSEMAVRSLQTDNPCSYVILEQEQEEEEGEDLPLVPEGTIALDDLRELKDLRPTTTHLLMTTTPRALLRYLRMTWRVGVSPRTQWVDSIMTNISRAGMDGLNVRIGRSPTEVETKQALMVLKNLRSRSPLHIAATLSLDITTQPKGMEFLKEVARYADMIIFENTVAQLAGRNDLSGVNSSLAETMSLIRKATPDPIVIKVPLYEGLRLQSLYQRLQQTISDMKSRFKTQQAADRGFVFSRTKKALWKTFRNSGCKLSASGDLIRENLKELLAEHPDLGVALWSLNHDDLTHICSDRNLYFTNLMFDEVIPKVEIPVPKPNTRLLEMTPTGPQLLIMQDPGIQAVRQPNGRLSKSLDDLTPKKNHKHTPNLNQNASKGSSKYQYESQSSEEASTRTVSKPDAKELSEGSQASHLDLSGSRYAGAPRIYSRIRSHNSPSHIILLAATPRHRRRPRKGEKAVGSNIKAIYDKVLQNRSQLMTDTVHTFTTSQSFHDGVPAVKHLSSQHRGHLVSVWASDRASHSGSDTRHRAKRDTETKVGSACDFDRPIPDPNDCRHYLMCNTGKLHRYYCGQNAVFDPEIKSCSSPNSVEKCKGLQTIWRIKEEANFKCESEGYYQHPKDCQLFFRCTRYSTHLFRCPDGLGFDATTATCDNKEVIPKCKSHLPNQIPDPIQTRKISNWRGDMQINEVEVPVFSAHQNLEDTQRRFDPAWKQGPQSDEVRTWQNGGMQIRIAADEEEVMRPKEPAPVPGQAYDTPEFRRIQIWPSVSPTVPSMRSPTPTKPSVPSQAPSKAPFQRPINEVKDARRAPEDPYQNMDVVHAPKQDYGSTQDKTDYGRAPEKPDSGQQGYEPMERLHRPEEFSTSFHFQEPMRLPVIQGHYQVQWPEQLTEEWLEQTGGISIAIARDFHCPTDGYFRDPKSCKRFYHCSHRLPYHVQCTGGLVFNPRNRICDWRKSMPECGSYENMRVMGGDAKEGWAGEGRRNATYQATGCIPGSVRTHPTNCNIFHVCSAVAVEYQFRCPEHLVFDEESRRCVAVSPIARCNSQDRKQAPEEESRSSENIIMDDPTDAAPDFRCPTTYGFYRDSENCSRFYECAFWIPFRLSCPAGSLFSAEHRRCEHADRVLECLPGGEAWKVAMDLHKAKQQVLKQAGISTGQNDILVFHCTQNGRFAEPSDCQIFHECDENGNHAEFRCPNNMAFNPAIGLCDLIHNVPSCRPAAPTRSRYEIQKSLPESPPQQQQQQQQRPSQQSNNYEHAWSVNGGSSAPLDMKPSVERPLIAPRVPGHLAGKIQLKQTGLPCQGDSVFHNPSDCRQFFWCYKEKLVMNTCPDPLVFNTDSYQCDLIEYVPRCNNSPLSSPSPTYSTSPSTPPRPSAPPQGPTVRRQEPPSLDQEVWKNGRQEAYYRLEEADTGPKQYQNQVTQAATQPQPEFQCPGDGFYRDPTNCAQFYYCKDGWRYKYACADGRAFDEARSFCNWAAYVPGCS